MNRFGTPRLLVVAFAGELAWPLSPVPILVALAVWLTFLVVPARPQKTMAAASAS